MTLYGKVPMNNFIEANLSMTIYGKISLNDIIVNVILNYTLW